MTELKASSSSVPQLPRPCTGLQWYCRWWNGLRRRENAHLKKHDYPKTDGSVTSYFLGHTLFAVQGHATIDEFN